MRILIAGAGAVGSYFGAVLARAGLDVVFLARGAHLAALRSSGGLDVRSIDGDFTVRPVAATDRLEPGPPVDLALVAVKSYDTAATADAIAPVVGPETLVLSLQNGVENEAVLASRLRLPPLLGAMTHVGAELVAPGVVRHVAEGTIYAGEPGGGTSRRTDALARILTAGGVRHRVSRNVTVELWDKLAWNAGHNAVTALTGMTAGTAAADPACGPVIRAAMLEVVAVARARGIDLDPARVDVALAVTRERMGDLRTSMLQDRERGRRLEHEALNGAVVRFGTAVGVPTPVNATLYGLAAAIDAAAARRPG